MKKTLCILFLLPVLLVAFSFSKAKAQDLLLIEDVQDPDGMVTNLTLVWDENSEPDIAGYNVYYGRESGHYGRLETVTEPTATIAVRVNWTDYFAMTAFTTDGAESPLSDEVHWP